MSSYQNEHFRPSIQPMVSLYAPPHYRLCIIKNKWKGFFFIGPEEDVYNIIVPLLLPAHIKSHISFDGLF